MTKLDETRTRNTHDSWETPEHVLERVREVFVGGIDLDPFTTIDNPTKAKFSWYLGGGDGYVEPWFESPIQNVFANPPYGRRLLEFSHKVTKEFYLSPAVSKTIITLTPCRTDTKWYDHLVGAADAVAEVRGRLKFRGWSAARGAVIDDAPAQFPSVFMYFGNRPDTFSIVFNRGNFARVRVT